MKKWGVLAAVAAFCACNGRPPSDAAKSSRFSPEQLEARYYYDLGPAALNVAALPPEQQANAGTFIRVCAQCHTLARSLNSPIVTKDEWTHYVQRMHEGSKTPEWKATVPAESCEQIAAFLAYESKIRKVDNKHSFDLLSANLKEMFKEVQAERTRLGR